MFAERLLAAIYPTRRERLIAWLYNRMYDASERVASSATRFERLEIHLRERRVRQGRHLDGVRTKFPATSGPASSDRPGYRHRSSTVDTST
jgi:hypothetical protein